MCFAKLTLRIVCRPVTDTKEDKSEDNHFIAKLFLEGKLLPPILSFLSLKELLAYVTVS